MSSAKTAAIFPGGDELTINETFEKIIYSFVFRSVPAGGLAPLNAKTSAS